jgi:hypothetical protein
VATPPKVPGPTGRNAFLLTEFEQCFCGRFRQRFLEVELRPHHVAELRASCTVCPAGCGGRLVGHGERWRSGDGSPSRGWGARQRGRWRRGRSRPSTCGASAYSLT